MEKSTLIPFLRENLEILFIGLNPATGSSRNKHYFSVKQTFWNQLFEAGLIKENVNKFSADNIVFGTNNINYNNWNYGITDLITEIAESNSSVVKPKVSDYENLEFVIKKYNPKTVVLLHGKVLKGFLVYLNSKIPKSNTGELGKLIDKCETNFFNIAFPHGNTITNKEKIDNYLKLKEYLNTNTP